MKKQQKIMLFVVICIVITGLMVFIWANQTGRIDIGANPIVPTSTQTGTVQGYPICKSVTVSTAKAGWYDSKTNVFIKEDKLCSGYTAKCISKGTGDMSAGWYKVKGDFKELIQYSNCTPSPTISPTTTSTATTKSCVDTDGGIVPQVFGTVTTKNGTLVDTQTDRCVDNGATLEEAYCESPTSSAVGFRKIYQPCQNGVVVSTPTSNPTANCIDECVSGNLVCTSNTSYQLCGNYDSDSCLEYQSNTCSADKICQNNTIITKPTSTPTTTPTTTPSTNPTPTSTIQTPSIPTNLKATEITSNSVKLTWDPVATAIRYGIYNANEVTWVDNVDTNTYTVSGLNCETDYSFQVTAINDEGYGSNPTNPVTVTTGQCQNITTDINTKKPENIKIEYDGINIIISWDGVSDANGYDIYNCSGAYIISTDQTSYTFKSSNCANDYCYYVIAHDSAGKESKLSDQVKITSDPCSVASTDDSDQDTSTVSITSLVSTGASLWFNIFIGVLLILGIGYFMFHDEILKNK